MICWSGDVLELWLDGTKTPWPVDGTLPVLSYKLRLWKPYNFLAKDCHKCHNFGFFEFRNDNCAPKSAWEKSDNKKTSMFRKRIVETWQLHSALNKIHHCAVTNSRMDLNLQVCKNVDQSSSSTWSKKNAVNFTEQSKEPHLQKIPRCGRRSLWAGTKDYNQRRKLLPSNACKQEEWFNRPFFLFLGQVQTCWVASCPECWQHELHPPRPPSRPSWPQGRNQPWRIWRISGLA